MTLRTRILAVVERIEEEHAQYVLDWQRCGSSADRLYCGMEVVEPAPCTAAAPVSPDEALDALEALLLLNGLVDSGARRNANALLRRAGRLHEQEDR